VTLFAKQKGGIMRIGIGYDLHRLVEGRDLIIGGVKIDYNKGLLGHSDADVLLHSVCDALLGACGLGNIGVQFPDTDPEYKDISSLALLEKVYSLVKSEKFEIENIDSVIIAEEPKLNPYINEMKKNIAKVLDITEKQIGIKATTHEGLGPVGKSEAIIAKTVALLKTI
jgi:2-C-methyl-D-erythritol 2,4-cyclodiphosphate synthase